MQLNRHKHATQEFQTVTGSTWELGPGPGPGAAQTPPPLGTAAKSTTRCTVGGYVPKGSGLEVEG